MTITIAPPTAALVFTTPTKYVDRSLATASWTDTYEILVGAYPFAWVNLDYTPWNPDPEVKTNGFLANVGPYYAQVRVQAVLKEEYRVNRLFTASSASTTVHDEAQVQTLTRTVYAYQVPGCPKGQRGAPLTSMMGGLVHVFES